MRLAVEFVRGTFSLDANGNYQIAEVLSLTISL